MKKFIDTWLGKFFTANFVISPILDPEPTGTKTVTISLDSLAQIQIYSEFEQYTSISIEIDEDLNIISGKLIR